MKSELAYMWVNDIFLLMAELVRSGLDAGVFSVFEVDGHASTLLANSRDVRQT